LELYKRFIMKDIIMCIDKCDNITQKYPIGWCVVEQGNWIETDEIDYDGYYLERFIRSNRFWVMLRMDGRWYKHGKFGDLLKAKKRMELIIDGEIEPW